MSFLGRVWENDEQKHNVTVPCLHTCMWLIHLYYYMMTDITILKGTLRHYLAGFEGKAQHNIQFKVKAFVHLFRRQALKYC